MLDGGRSFRITYLLVHHRSQSRLPFDDRIRHPHLPTQRRQENNQLNRIHVIRDEHQARLLVLNQAHHVIEPVFHGIRLLAHILLLLALAHRRSFFMQAFLLLGFRLGLVFGEQLEGLRRGVAV